MNTLFSVKDTSVVLMARPWDLELGRCTIYGDMGEGRHRWTSKTTRKVQLFRYSHTKPSDDDCLRTRVHRWWMDKQFAKDKGEWI